MRKKIKRSPPCKGGKEIKFSPLSEGGLGGIINLTNQVVGNIGF
jgi:hypothetical protein